LNFVIDNGQDGDNEAERKYTSGQVNTVSKTGSVYDGYDKYGNIISSQTKEFNISGGAVSGQKIYTFAKDAVNNSFDIWGNALDADVTNFVIKGNQTIKTGNQKTFNDKYDYSGNVREQTIVTYNDVNAPDKITIEKNVIELDDYGKQKNVTNYTVETNYELKNNANNQLLSQAEQFAVWSKLTYTQIKQLLGIDTAKTNQVVNGITVRADKRAGKTEELRHAAVSESKDYTYDKYDRVEVFTRNIKEDSASKERIGSDIIRNTYYTLAEIGAVGQVYSGQYNYFDRTKETGTISKVMDKKTVEASYQGPAIDTANLPGAKKEDIAYDQQGLIQQYVYYDMNNKKHVVTDIKYSAGLNQVTAYNDTIVDTLYTLTTTKRTGMIYNEYGMLTDYIDESTSSTTPGLTTISVMKNIQYSDTLQELGYTTIADRYGVKAEAGGKELVIKWGDLTQQEIGILFAMGSTVITRKINKVDTQITVTLELMERVTTTRDKTKTTYNNIGQLKGYEDTVVNNATKSLTTIVSANNIVNDDQSRLYSSVTKTTQNANWDNDVNGIKEDIITTTTRLYTLYNDLGQEKEYKESIVNDNVTGTNVMTYNTMTNATYTKD
jgi:hypothetical protein